MELAGTATVENALYRLPRPGTLCLPGGSTEYPPGHRTSLTPLEAARQLRTYVFDHFKYIKGITTVETTLDEVWKLKAGVCQDFAHILLVFLRQIRIPARYVSGYICPNSNGMRGEGATHAWIEAFIPFNGWVGLDPTNNCEADDLHVRLAVGRNFSDCSPVKGTYKGAAGQQLEVGVSVSYEDGRTQRSSGNGPGPAALRKRKRNKFLPALPGNDAAATAVMTGPAQRPSRFPVCSSNSSARSTWDLRYHNLDAAKRRAQQRIDRDRVFIL